MLMIALRLIHVLSGVFWAGTLFFFAGFVLPSIIGSGLAGDKFIRYMVVVRRFPTAIAIASILAILSGFGMYWRDVSISAGAFSRSRPGMAYGIGGLSALIALGIAIRVIAPTGETLVKLGDLIEAGGDRPTPEQAASMASLQGRLAGGTRFGAGLLLITVVCMAIARYL